MIAFANPLTAIGMQRPFWPVDPIREFAYMLQADQRKRAREETDQEEKARLYQQADKTAEFLNDYRMQSTLCRFAGGAGRW